MSDDDYTPDDGADSTSDPVDGDCDRERDGGCFHEEQYAFDKVERDARNARRSGCVLLLLALPAAGLLVWLR
jgi:hypothetical protein